LKLTCDLMTIALSFIEVHCHIASDGKVTIQISLRA